MVDGRRRKWTSIASPYPPSLCAAWAAAIDSWHQANGPRQQASARPPGRGGAALNQLGTGPSRVLTSSCWAYYAHIDDHAVFGSDRKRVQIEAAETVDRLRSTGFVVAEATPPAAVDRYVGYASQVAPARWTLPRPKLAQLDAALAHFLSFTWFDVAILRSVVGSLNWVFLLRRPLFSILHAVSDILEAFGDGAVVRMSPAVRAELKCARRVLVLAWADTHRLIAPTVLAQDAEGSNATDHGGWGLGFALPDLREVVTLASQSMGHGLPKELARESSGDLDTGRCARLSDLHVPDSWTNGQTTWCELLAGRFAHDEHINIYESRVLLRALQVISKIAPLRRSRVLSLEDNAVTHYIFRRGRSSR